MTDTISESIFFTIALILLGAVLSLSMYAVNAGNAVADVINDDIATRELLQEYRAYAKYDGKVLTGTDVISLVLSESGGKIDVVVNNAPATYTYLPSTVRPAMLTLQNQFRYNYNYSAALVTDANGTLRQVVFDRI
jgi:hypothetical protein